MTKYIDYRTELVEFLIQNIVAYYQIIEDDKIVKLRSELVSSDIDDLYRIANMVDRFGMECFDMMCH